MRHVTTDSGGLLAVAPPLSPDARFRIVEDLYLPPAASLASRQAVVDWIDACVLGDLRTVTLGVRARDSLSLDDQHEYGGCNFLLAAACCMALEYCGLVYGHGDDATSRVRRFVQDFLAPIDARYLDVFPIWWTCYRNGLAHGSWPQYVCLEGCDADHIAVGANTQRDGEHFGPAREHAGLSLTISTVRFLEDLETAVRGDFGHWILTNADEGVRERAGPRLHRINQKNAEGKTALATVLRWNNLNDPGDP